MAEQWFYMSGGEKKGPISSAVLKQLASSGQLKPSDFVWHHGLQEWVVASKIRGLFSDDATEPPPVSAPPPLPQISTVPTTTNKNSQTAESRYRSVRQQRFLPATSWFDLFDWKFQKYLTPWIVRATWVVSIVLSAVWIAVILLGVLLSWIPNSRSSTPRSSAFQGSDFELPEFRSTESRSPGLPRWFTRRVLSTIGGITALCAVIITTLWIRVILEMAIVLFNIANTLASIEQKIESSSGAESA